jgi:hypothetical protein
MSDIWIFLKYVVKRPFEDIWQIVTNAFQSLNKFNHPKPWIYFSVVGYTITRFLNKNAVLNLGFFKPSWDVIFLMLLLFSFLWFEYERGEWKYEYRQSIKERVKKINEEKDGEERI